MADREHWAGRTGFILAAAGSAIGLGNIWRFPYLAGENGGAAFVLVYLLIVATLGLSLMLAEMTIGRAAQRNPAGAFALLGGGRWRGVGLLGVATGFLILAFYSVVGGWTLAYAAEAAGRLAGLAGAAADPGGAFKAFIADPLAAVGWHLLFMALTVAVVAGGVRRGIERWNTILMPVLFILVIVLVVRGLTLPGAARGIAFYLAPDFSRIDGGTILLALSQAFFSLSLGMGAMITYGSYARRTENLPASAGSATALDTLAALLAGFMIFPAVFALGFDPAAGPGLTFVTLPAVFERMPGGAVFALAFFALLSVAALTSAVSLLEVVVAYAIDERGLTRRRATLLAGAAIFLLGVPCALSFGVAGDLKIAGKTAFDLFDYATTNLMLPIGGILISLFVGWKLGDRAVAEAVGAGMIAPRWTAVWIAICRYVAPAAIAWVLIAGL